MDIQTRQDVDRLVRTFYNKVREDFLLKPIFNTSIPREDLWEHHFVKLVDFWEAGLLRGTIYEGKPIGLHLWVDNITGRVITQKHFDRWLSLWKETVNQLFQGPVATKALQKADILGKSFYDKIMDART